MTAADRVDRILGQVAAFGDRTDEATVRVAQLVEQRDPLFIGVRAEHALGIGALAALERIDRNAEPLDQAGEIELAEEDADRSGDRHRLGEDRVATRRDEVAPRGCEVAHRAHDRFDLAGREHFARDQLGGERTAAGRVDAHDDRTDRRIFARGGDRLDDRLTASERLADQRHGLGLAVGDVAVDIDQCDRRPLPAFRARGRGHVDGIDAAEVGHDQLGHLVGRGHGVDELGILRELARGVRAVVDDRLQLGRREVARRRHGAHPLLPQRVEQLLVHPRRDRRRASLGELLGRALVLADLLELRQHADLIEGAAEVERLSRHADEAQPASGVDVDLVGGRGDEIIAARPRHHVREHFLVRGA